MKRILLTLSALLISGGAFAQAYAGFAGGSSKQNFECPPSATCKTTDIGFKVFGGYKFTPMFAAELGYADFGKEKATRGSATAVVQTTSFSLVGAAFFELAPSLTGVARLGVASNKAKGSGPARTTTDTSTQPYFGMGLGYEVAPSVTLTGGADFTKSKGGNETANALLVSIGLTFGF